MRFPLDAAGDLILDAPIPQPPASARRGARIASDTTEPQLIDDDPETRAANLAALRARPGLAAGVH